MPTPPKRRANAATATAAVLTAVAACGGGAGGGAGGKPAQSRALNVATSANITTWDPVKSFSTYPPAMKLLVEQAPGFCLDDARDPMASPKTIKGLTCRPDYAFTMFFHQPTPR
ncbi:hypothetical protein SAMN05421505_111174 [Sinosporangium album]|uniref:Uncharacterized protein n=1 Tax=Sinosporangium album TaxID=504805 RepID=A0A1G7ZRM9_9ACTN|nr:hypothetical protein [Sinosporangium album]SDH11349.1 hypothetical protein SAMN05421505_111174 [Sinosporangium album]